MITASQTSQSQATPAFLREGKERGEGQRAGEERREGQRREEGQGQRREEGGMGGVRREDRGEAQ
jgi:hypothetical protein